MSIMERLIDVRKSMTAKVIAVIVSISLIVSLTNISAFAEGNGYDGEFAPVEQAIAQVQIELENAVLQYDGKEFTKSGTIPAKPHEEFTVKVEAVEGYMLQTVEAVVKDEAGSTQSSELKANTDGEYVIPADLVTDALTIKAKAVVDPQKIESESVTSETKIQPQAKTQSKSFEQPVPADANQEINSESVYSESNQTVNVQELYLIPNKYLVSVGDTFTVKKYIQPADATVDHVEWVVDNSKAEIVAQNNDQAQIKALATGELGISVKVYTTNTEYEEASVDVSVDPIAVSSVQITGYNKEYLLSNESFTLQAKVDPVNAENKELKWVSSDSNIVSVDQNGNIKAESQGNATITASTENGKYDSIDITVYNAAPKEVQFQIWNTNKNQNQNYKALIPSDGTEVVCSNLFPSMLTANGKKYVVNNMLRVNTGDNSNQPAWSNISEAQGKWEKLSLLRVNDGKIQYKQTKDRSWTNLNSSTLCVFCDFVYEDGVQNSNDVAVIVGDWPYGKNEATNQKKKQIQIKVIDTENAKQIYDSGSMRYSDGSNGEYGKIKFNCLDSIYQVQKVTVSKNGNEEQEVNYNSESGVSVNFSGNTEEKYIVIAYVNARSFNVQYDLNGAESQTGFESYQVKPINNALVQVSSAIPNRNGYIFAGWQFDGSTYMPGESFTMPVKDVTLTAKWEPVSEMISYSAEEGGKVTRSTERVSSSRDTSYGSTANANPGYTFLGWYKENQLVSADKTFKPAYEAAQYTAKFALIDAKVNGFEGVYDGKAHSIQVINNLPYWTNTKIQYSEDGTTWSEANPQYIDVKLDENGKPIPYTVYTRIVFTFNNHDYPIWSGQATVKITQRPVTVTGYGWTEDQTYTGTAYSNDTFKTEKATETNNRGVIGEDAINGVTYKIEGTNVQADPYKGVFTGTDAVKVMRGETEVTKNYAVSFEVGSLKIVKATDNTVTVPTYTDENGNKINGATKVYDNTALTLSDVQATKPGSTILYAASENAPAGEWTTTAPTLTDAGSMDVWVKATNPNYEDTSAVKATLVVTQRPVTVTTNSANRVYNGQALTAPGKIEGLVDNQTVEFNTIGTQTEVGSTKNAYTLAWIGTALESNYRVSENLGTLTVIPQSINPEDPTEPTDDPNRPVYNGVQVSTPIDVVYNGQIQNQPIQVTDADGNALPEDAYIVTYTDAVNVGTVTVTITGQGNYAGQVTRTYQITPATLTVTTPSATKTFDGAALTNTAGTIEGLQGNDSVTFTVNGTQTTVGNSVNTYAIDWNNALASNYTIVENLGTLTVNAAPVVPVVPTPTPVPAGPGAPAVAPGVPTPAAAAAAAPLAAPVATITDDATPLAAGETIDDEDTPLAAFDHVDCWVHWLILAGIILTAIYGAVVVRRRLAVVKDVDDLEDEVLDGAVAGATQSAPADNRQAI